MAEEDANIITLLLFKTYKIMEKRSLLKTMLLLFALIAGSSSVWAQSTYELVTNVSSLADGDKIIIVAGISDGTQKALGGANGSNNRKAVNVTVSDNAVTTNVDNGNETVANVNTKTDARTLPYEVTLVKSGDNWLLKEVLSDGDVYLNGGYGKTQGASSNNNHLKAATEAVTDAGKYNNGVYSIAIDGTSSVATISNQNSWEVKLNNTVFATYESGYTDVYIYKKVVSSPLASIAVSGTYKTSFYVGDTFTHDGAIVTASYENGSSRAVTASATFSDPDMSSAGVKTITVSYTENAVTKTTTYDITVNELPTLSSISLSGTYTTTFDQYSLFNHDGLVVTAHFDDSSSSDVSDEAEVSAPDMTTAGEKTITVSYTIRGVTKSTTYNITVNAYIQPTDVTINLSNTLFGIASAGSNATEQSTTVNNVTITTGCKSSASSKTYYASDHIRFYADSYLILQAPSGFVITGISLNRKGTDTWNGDKVTPSTGAFNGTPTAGTAPLVWSGAATTVRFDYSGQCRTASVDVTLTEAKNVTITAAGWASFSSASALDFTKTDVTAYIAKSNGGTSSVTLTEIAKVPASTGIVVNAPAGTYAIPVLAGEADATTGNLLKPWLTAGTPGDATYYTLAAGPTFKKSSGGTLAAGKAYLVMPAASAPELGVDFGGTTGIDAIQKQAENGEFYNLAGQRVAQPTKGLYIMNGKKYMVK